MLREVLLFKQIDPQFETGATQAARIFTGCWAFTVGALQRAMAVNAASSNLGNSIFFLPYRLDFPD